MSRKAAEFDQFQVRLPDGMRDRLKHEADMSGRSMNAEIVQRLKESLEADDTSRNRPRGDRATTINLPEMLRGRIYAKAEDNERTLNSEILYTLEREYPELAHLNDIVDLMNLRLAQARKRGSNRDLYELEMVIRDIYGFYVNEVTSDEVKPPGEYAIKSLDDGDD